MDIDAYAKKLESDNRNALWIIAIPGLMLLSFTAGLVCGQYGF